MIPDHLSVAAITSLVVASAPHMLETLRGTLLSKGKKFLIGLPDTRILSARQGHLLYTLILVSLLTLEYFAEGPHSTKEEML